ncbi:hypothetical protein B0T21DRAFT_184531 [Apiosordaria backusii]|uniref:Uncharacterized protein n=1 Tax=Apiosordaria backusii TaxID=314023 RepID=A0AA40BJM0_9PEZI|nr:hypothetical protein B0T21DRAFT_184531 [Apiosordaria backusii]
MDFLLSRAERKWEVRSKEHKGVIDIGLLEGGIILHLIRSSSRGRCLTRKPAVVGRSVALVLSLGRMIGLVGFYHAKFWRASLFIIRTYLFLSVSFTYSLGVKRVFPTTGPLCRPLVFGDSQEQWKQSTTHRYKLGSLRELTCWNIFFEYSVG